MCVILFSCLRQWNDYKLSCGQKCLISLKTISDFYNAPHHSWANYKKILATAKNLCTLTESEQLDMLAPDLDQIIIDLGLKKDERIGSICLSIRDAIANGKMKHTKPRRWFAVCHELETMSRTWSCLAALMRICREELCLTKQKRRNQGKNKNLKERLEQNERRRMMLLGEGRDNK